MYSRPYAGSRRRGYRLPAIAARINHKMMRATMGLKSNIPRVGKTRRRGASTGSVIWLTTWLILSSKGWGRAPAMGMTKDRITLVKMAMVNRMMM